MFSSLSINLSCPCFSFFFFFFNDTATTEIYTLSLHDALPISSSPDEIRRLLKTGARHPCPNSLITSYRANRLGKSGRVFWIHIEPGLPCHFRQSSSVRNDDWCSTSHRFQHWQSKSLVSRRKDEKVCSGIQGWQILGNDISCKHNIVTDAEGIKESLCLLSPARINDQYKLCAEPTFQSSPLVGPEQGRHVLVWPECANIKNVSPLYSIAYSHLSNLGRRSRVKSLVASRINNTYAPFIYGQHFHQILLGSL